MAIYHCSVKVISRGKGQSATASAAYRSAEKITDMNTGEIYDYTRKERVNYRTILMPVGSPTWASDRSLLWNEVEKIEKRKDAQLAREVEVALPRELNRQAQWQLVRDFCNDNFVSKGMIADICIHEQDGDNPHAHIMLTTRDISSSGFGKKNREWNNKVLLNEWREDWASQCNKLLDKSNHIDHRSHKERGLEAIPTKKEGVNPRPEVKAHNQMAKRINKQMLDIKNKLQEGFGNVRAATRGSRETISRNLRRFIQNQRIASAEQQQRQRHWGRQEANEYRVAKSNSKGLRR